MTKRDYQRIQRWINSTPLVKVLGVKVVVADGRTEVTAKSPHDLCPTIEDGDKIIHMVDGAVSYVRWTGRRK